MLAAPPSWRDALTDEERALLVALRAMVSRVLSLWEVMAAGQTSPFANGRTDIELSRDLVTIAKAEQLDTSSLRVAATLNLARALVAATVSKAHLSAAVLAGDRERLSFSMHLNSVCLESACLCRNKKLQDFDEGVVELVCGEPTVGVTPVLRLLGLVELHSIDTALRLYGGEGMHPGRVRSADCSACSRVAQTR